MEALIVHQAADYIGLLQSFLNKRRAYSGGPLYIKVGKRIVYAQLDLDMWPQRQKIENTSQALLLDA